MPFIHLSTTKVIKENQKEELADEIAKLVTIMPGKPYERTMVRIDTECDIYRAGEIADCAYLQTHLRKPVPFELQQEYIEKLFKLFGARLGLENSQIYMSIVELDAWGSKGELSK